MNTYKISWIDGTICRQPSKIFKYWKTTQNEYDYKEVIAWDFFEATPKTLKKEVIKWLENESRVVEVFSVALKYGKKVVLTEEDLGDY